MEMQWMMLALITAIAGAACALASAAMVRTMRRALAEKQREIDGQWQAMAATVRALQTRVAEIDELQAKQNGSSEMGDRRGDGAEETRRTPEPETIAVLTAAATAFLGQSARVSQAQALPQSGAVMWAQQGRTSVQTSHNPRSRR